MCTLGYAAPLERGVWWERDIFKRDSWVVIHFAFGWTDKDKISLWRGEPTALTGEIQAIFMNWTICSEDTRRRRSLPLPMAYSSCIWHGGGHRKLAAYLWVLRPCAGKNSWHFITAQRLPCQWVAYSGMKKFTDHFDAGVLIQEYGYLKSCPCEKSPPAVCNKTSKKICKKLPWKAVGKRPEKKLRCVGEGGKLRLRINYLCLWKHRADTVKWMGDCKPLALLWKRYMELAKTDCWESLNELNERTCIIFESCEIFWFDLELWL